MLAFLYGYNCSQENINIKPKYNLKININCDMLRIQPSDNKMFGSAGNVMVDKITLRRERHINKFSLDVFCVLSLCEQSSMSFSIT